MGNENWFWLMAAPFGLGALLMAFTFWRDKRDLKLLGHHNLVLSPGLALGRRILRGTLMMTGLFLILLGAARLQGKLTPQDLVSNGVDVMIVLDVSKSMLTQDVEPNRLEAAKQTLLSWLRPLEGDRVGLVLFAGEALIQVPLTLDMEAASLLLERADVDAVSKGGTDIGEGIRTALAAFPKEDGKGRGKAILLMTDGEPTRGASSAGDSFQEAKEKKIPIVAVGMGTRQGRPIPDGVSFWGEGVYKKYGDGRVVISRLDEELLKNAAETTGGVFIHGDSAQGLASVRKILDQLQKTQMKGLGVMKREELSPALGVWAAGALMLSGIL
jgi:Ca-activated chloride channel family protein